MHYAHKGEWDMQDVWIAAVAYLDDIYILASSVEHAQIMLDEVVIALGNIGLSLQIAKVRVMTDKYGLANPRGDSLYVDNLPIQQVESLKVLGSMISHDGAEKLTIEHRIQRAWACYWKWQKVLEGQASLKASLLFWQSTCFWCVCFAH